MFTARLISALLSVASFFMIGTGVYLGLATAILDKPTLNQENTYYYLPKGSGLLRASYIAEQNHLVETSWHYIFAAKKLGLETRLKAGEYEISPNRSLRKVLGLVSSGATHKRRITVAEGLSNIQIVALLEESFGVEVDQYSIPAEGNLLPDTYFYERGDTVTNLLERMQSALTSKLDTAWAERSDNLPITDKHQALILASIVEKETAVREERGKVAAVFLNRLRRNMRLQSDPTVIYGITGGLPLGRPISRSDLKDKTPYNTYTNAGLPPTPIANPGIDSIRAVLNPTSVKHLYFVADGSGGHAFANTLQEHNRNVAAWRAIERARNK